MKTYIVPLFAAAIMGGSMAGPGVARPLEAFDYLPVMGDWDGDGKDEPGLYKRSTGEWFLPGFAPFRIKGGVPLGFDTFPLAGNWYGDKKGDRVGVYHQTSGQFYVAKDHDGNRDIDTFAIPDTPKGASTLPLAGNWYAHKGEKHDRVGVFEQTSAQFYLARENRKDVPRDIGTFAIQDSPKGCPFLLPRAGNWFSDNGEKCDRVGVFDMRSGKYYLAHKNDKTPRKMAVVRLENFTGNVPISGDWYGDGEGDRVGVYNAANFRWYQAKDQKGERDIPVFEYQGTECMIHIPLALVDRIRKARGIADGDVVSIRLSMEPKWPDDGPTDFDRYETLELSFGTRLYFDEDERNKRDRIGKGIEFEDGFVDVKVGLVRWRQFDGQLKCLACSWEEVPVPLLSVPFRLFTSDQSRGLLGPGFGKDRWRLGRSLIV